MKKVNIILIILLLVSCQKKINSSNKANNIFPFYVGTYTSGDSRGIYRYQGFSRHQIQPVNSKYQWSICFRLLLRNWQEPNSIP